MSVFYVSSWTDGVRNKDSEFSCEEDLLIWANLRSKGWHMRSNIVIREGRSVTLTPSDKGDWVLSESPRQGLGCVESEARLNYRLLYRCAPWYGEGVILSLMNDMDLVLRASELSEVQRTRCYTVSAQVLSRMCWQKSDLATLDAYLPRSYKILAESQGCSVNTLDSLVECGKVNVSTLHCFWSYYRVHLEGDDKSKLPPLPPIPPPNRILPGDIKPSPGLWSKILDWLLGVNSPKREPLSRGLRWWLGIPNKKPKKAPEYGDDK